MKPYIYYFIIAGLMAAIVFMLAFVGLMNLNIAKLTEDNIELQEQLDVSNTTIHQLLNDADARCGNLERK